VGAYAVTGIAGEVSGLVEHDLAGAADRGVVERELGERGGAEHVNAAAGNQRERTGDTREPRASDIKLPGKGDVIERDAAVRRGLEVARAAGRERAAEDRGAGEVNVTGRVGGGDGGTAVGE